MKEIGIIVSQLRGFEHPILHLEQYETDGDAINFFISKVASDIVGRRVIDLGCGTGYLSFACALAGAGFVVGVELDMNALRIALSNLLELRRAGYLCDVLFVCADVRRFHVRKNFDVCVMNPPFGIQKKFSDRIFLKKAIDVANVVWTFLSRDSEPFVKAFARENLFEISAVFRTKIHIRRRFPFHRKKVEFLEVDLYRLHRTGNIGPESL